MPEGDTVHKLAAALGQRLSGRELRDGRVRGEPRARLAGRRIGAIRARGKHLWIELDGDLVLRSHLGMHGTWHRYRPGERWHKPERHAAIVLATDDDVLVCFHPSEVELGSAGSRAFDLERRLGPDLVEGVPDASETLRRARHFLELDAPLVDVLLDQRVASGVGNVYKSEVLFLERVHPLTPLAAVDEPLLARLLGRAHELLRANLHGGPRVTRPAGAAGRLWVYGRKGQPCFECDAPIAAERLGRGLRSTYWCPRCQHET